ncbi:hypothetical protein U3A55_03475 [Salarchaeum sp. III]|uniref:hypothetical protein n=1 Tax=Salarchaeum sp. III TaxID=3107927 RepID=UPI002ED78CA9
MNGPNRYDDASHDHERFEDELVAQDQDATQVATEGIDETGARHLAADLVEAGVVTPVAEERVLVHEPSNAAFDSIRQLAVFHRGWTAACDADEEDA